MNLFIYDFGNMSKFADNLYGQKLNIINKIVKTTILNITINKKYRYRPLTSGLEVYCHWGHKSGKKYDHNLLVYPRP